MANHGELEGLKFNTMFDFIFGRPQMHLVDTSLGSVDIIVEYSCGHDCNFNVS